MYDYFACVQNTSNFVFVFLFLQEVHYRILKSAFYMMTMAFAELGRLTGGEAVNIPESVLGLFEETLPSPRCTTGDVNLVE